MINKFLSAIKKYNMLSAGDRVLLAVSGGADSVVMLRLFTEAMQMLSVSVEVAHIEHGIRGAESVSDADFVRRLCEENHIKFSMLRIDALKEAKEAGMTVEEYARKRRYAYFDTFDVDKIATAHNADDNAETLIFRLARGSGLKGASAIPPVRGRIIRPLIECSGSEIRAYADRNHIAYRIDSTNSENTYTRNYIRNIVLPDLKKINDSAICHLNAFISDASEDNDFILSASVQAYNDCIDDGKLIINKLKSCHISIIKRVLLQYFSMYDVSVDRAHLLEIIKLLDKSGRIQINGNNFAVSHNGMLYMHNYASACAFTIPHYDTIRSKNFNNCNVDFYCDYDKIVGKVYFRSRQSGDTVSPAGRGCTKTLKKLFNEYKIPAHKRSSVPVICDDAGIIGIVGYCVDERVKTDSGTETIFYCKIPMED